MDSYNAAPSASPRSFQGGLGSQFITLTAHVERFTWNPPEKFGGRFGFQIATGEHTLDYNGETVTFQRSKAWVNIDVPESAINKPRHVAITEAGQRGSFNVLLIGGKIKQSRTGRNSLNFPLSAVRLIGSTGMTVNTVILTGQCSSIDGRWLMIEEVFRRPNPKGDQGQFDKRYVRVYLPHPMGIQVGQPLYVEGEILFKLPTGDPDLFINAKRVI